MPGRAQILRCVAVVALVALLPVLGTVGGGAFGFPAAAVWALVVAPVALVLLAWSGNDEAGDDDSETGA